MKKRVKIIIIFILIALILFPISSLIRIIPPRELDDVSPTIPCEKDLLKKSNIFWVIPRYKNISISENKEWCNYILSFNKTIGMHGVTHEYQEFKTNRNQEYLDEGIRVFEECFGFEPTIFKPPQLEISKNNKQLIKNNNLNLKLNFNQFIHKVYHCNNTGKYSNRFIDFF